MKLKIIVTFLIVFVLGAVASAQTKLSGTLQCGKAEPVYTIQIGDRSDHAFTISKLTCTWTKPTEIGGVIHKGEEVAVFGEVGGNRVRGRSQNVDTMTNGDKYYVSTRYTETLKEGVLQTTEVKWTITGGTGKLKGMSGKGTTSVFCSYRSLPCPVNVIVANFEYSCDKPLFADSVLTFGDHSGVLRQPTFKKPCF